MQEIAGPAADALASLSPAQIHFIQSIPKAELHAHLNGSIPISILQQLASEYQVDPSSSLPNEAIQSGIQKLVDGVSLDKLDDFFSLFPAIYALISTPDALRRATRAVLSAFLDGDTPECNYLELRSTPRQTDHLSREQYLRIMLEEMERYPPEKACLIASLDRRMDATTLRECLTIAGKLKAEGQRLVGIDLCGDPTAGDISALEPYFAEAKKLGLGTTFHIAETAQNSPIETLKFLSFNPDRLGHATFLDEEATSVVLEKKMCIEICLSSNLLCKTVADLGSHHIHQYLKSNHPIAICTDDMLPFRTSLLGEYALLLAKPPFGLGLSEDEVRRVGEMSMKARFK